MQKPLHIAVILDGNRRYAKKHKLALKMGHEKGVQTVENLLKYGKENDLIKELTLYVFSAENFNRKKDEVDYLMKLFVKEFNKFKDEDYLEKYKVKFRFIGRIDMFPEEIQGIVKDLEEKSSKYDDYICNVALGYGGRQEIVDAAKKIAEEVANGDMEVDDIDEEIFKNHLYMADEPDILIRTGGDKRISNFLIWQSNYSELFFLEKLWPEVTKEDFDKIIEDFKKRERRYGQ